MNLVLTNIVSLSLIILIVFRMISGSVERNVPLGPNGVFYLPQKPYFSNGTLREQVSYQSKFVVMSSVHLLK